MKRTGLYIIICSIVGLFMSCTKEYDGVFEQSPDARTSIVVDEYTKTLQSSEYGWLVHYYPNPEILGGFTFVLKFDKEGVVKMNWGYQNQADEQALYSVKMFEKPVLSFDTYSMFTKMADPAIGGEYGKGFGGDNEFAFIRMSPNKDTIYMQERTGSKSPLVLVKAGATTWADIKNYPAMAQIIQRTDEKVVPFYYNLTVTGWNTPVTMTYFDDQQQVNLFYKQNGKDTLVKMGINFTHEGFEFHHALEINGIKVRSFKYDALLNQHIVTDKGVKGSFSYSTTCASVAKGAATRFFGKGNFGTSKSRLSAKMKTTFENLNPNSKLVDCGYQAYGLSFATNFSIAFKDWSSVTMNIDKYEITGENTVVLHFGSYYEWDEGFSQQLMETPLGQQFRNLLFSPKGWTVVPLSFVQYGAQCAFVSNEDPEMYIFFL